MIPDLDQYAGTVLGAYGVTLVLLAALLAVSWLRAKRVARDLAKLEAQAGRGAAGRRDGRSASSHPAPSMKAGRGALGNRDG